MEKNKMAINKQEFYIKEWLLTAPEFQLNYFRKLTQINTNLSDREKLICCCITFMESKNEIAYSMGLQSNQILKSLKSVSLKLGYTSVNSFAKDLILGIFIDIT